MTPLQAHAGAQPAGALPETCAFQLYLQDTLASSSRLWVRGRVVVGDLPVAGLPGWRDRWLGPKPLVAETPRATVQTHVLGETLELQVPLSLDGSFEACFVVGDSSAKRGWRVARHQVRLGGYTARACGVVLTPATDTATAVVVVLPSAFTRSKDGPRLFAHSGAAERLTPLFRFLRRRQPDATFYYLGTDGDAGADRLAEVALAATSLGWPNGHVVLLPAATGREPVALAHSVDRLRWLFAGEIELRVLNLEPSADAILGAAVGEAPDRALVRRFVAAAGDPAGLLDAADTTAFPAPSAPRVVRVRGVPRFPVVFCHGMLAMSMLRRHIPEEPNYFAHLRTFLSERGVQALFPRVEPTGGVAGRAEQLRDQIRRWTGEPVNIIAHSMGGLDARFLISRLGFADRVRSLTTIASPHQGTPLADWFVTNWRDRVPLLRGLEALGVKVDGFRDCRRAACRALNDTTPDAASVAYFCYVGAVAVERVTPLLRRSWHFMTSLEGPNDGLVSARSARRGEYLGTLAVDHFAQTPDGLFVHPAEDFDAVGFYSRLVEDLARRGL
jgi:triacylglycerol lipase